MGDDNTQDTNKPSPASAGSQPVAWAVIPGTVLAGRAWRVTLDKEEAEQLSCGAMLVVPLYEQPQPTLTDEEREAVAYCVSCAQDYRETLDCCEQSEKYGRATRMIDAAMRVVILTVGPAPGERRM
jgi:hypothetical protein